MPLPFDFERLLDLLLDLLPFLAVLSFFFVFNLLLEVDLDFKPDFFDTVDFDLDLLFDLEALDLDALDLDLDFDLPAFFIFFFVTFFFFLTIFFFLEEALLLLMERAGLKGLSIYSTPFFYEGFP